MTPSTGGSHTEAPAGLRRRHDERTFVAVALGGITLVAALLRLHQLEAPSLWFDEIASVYLSRAPLRLLWSDWMSRESNPPLYYSLLHVWIWAFGDSEFAIRSLSAVSGSLNPLLVYAIGRELAGLPNRWRETPAAVTRPWERRDSHFTKIALLAALLTALSMRDIVSSQEARAYVFTETAALLAILGLVRFLARPGATWSGGSIRSLAIYVTGCTAALYLHNTMVVLPLLTNVVFLTLWLLRRPLAGRVLLLWLAANALCLGLWLWWALITVRQLGSGAPDIAWMQRLGPSEAVLMVIGVLVPRPGDALPRVMAALGLCFVVYGLLRLPRQQAFTLAVFLIGAPLVLFGLSAITPLLTRRTLLWAQFAGALAVSAGLLAVPRAFLRGVMAGAVVLVAASGVLDVQKSRVAEPWRDVVAALTSTLGPSDAVVLPDDAVGLPIHYYCERRTCPFTILQAGQQRTRWSVGLSGGPVTSETAKADRLAKSGQVVGIEYTYLTLDQTPTMRFEPMADWREPELPIYMKILRRAAPQAASDGLPSPPRDHAAHP